MPGLISRRMRPQRLLIVLVLLLTAAPSKAQQAPPDAVLRSMIAAMDSLRTDFYFFQQHQDVLRLTDPVGGSDTISFPADMPPSAIAEYRYRDSIRKGMCLNMDSSVVQKLDTAICLLRCQLQRSNCSACSGQLLRFETMDWMTSLPPHGVFLYVLKWPSSNSYLLLFDHSWEHLDFSFSGDRLQQLRLFSNENFAHFDIRRQ